MSENINPAASPQVSVGGIPNEIYSLDYVLEQIEMINAQTGYLESAFEALSQMSDGENPEAYSPGNLTGQAKAQAIGEAVRCRETTNQQLLKFYEKMYEDIRPKEQTLQDKAMDMVNRSLGNDQLRFEEISSLLDNVRHIGR